MWEIEKFKEFPRSEWKALTSDFLADKNNHQGLVRGRIDCSPSSERHEFAKPRCAKGALQGLSCNWAQAHFIRKPNLLVSDICISLESENDLEVGFLFAKWKVVKSM